MYFSLFFRFKRFLFLLLYFAQSQQVQKKTTLMIGVKGNLLQKCYMIKVFLAIHVSKQNSQCNCQLVDDGRRCRMCRLMFAMLHRKSSSSSFFSILLLLLLLCGRTTPAVCMFFYLFIHLFVFFCCFPVCCQNEISEISSASRALRS